ncbi:MAG TPA: type II secretion system protein [Candidatus Paceibacterota bacterium]|nr:type II secretion system protein [Candidatus Paceibacterota bacterium]HPT18228.1 type II secretion system protein [Candidatus Paceibacterota bacterium]
MTKENNKKIKLASGFTMIETMVAISIFLIVVTIGAGALINAYAINQKSQNLRSVVDSLSFIVEDMSRNIRVGYNYKCFEKGYTVGQEYIGIPSSCENGYGIAFEYSTGDTADNNDQWVYYIANGKLYRSTSGLSNYVQMNPDEVFIDSSKSNISILGAENTLQGDTQQPIVKINLVGTITVKKVVTPFAIQTSVSQRMNDI